MSLALRANSNSEIDIIKLNDIKSLERLEEFKEYMEKYHGI